jgi:hypothetical protein
MPNPTISDVHVDAVLTNISVAFMQDAQGFVADQVFPVVGVRKQSDKYFIYDKGDFFRAEMEIRAPGTESEGGGYRVSTGSYYSDVWALHFDLDEQTRSNYDDPLDAEGDASAYLSQQAMIRKDKQWIADYFATSIWTGDQTGVGAAPGANQFLQWNVVASTPIKDIRAQILAIKGRTGYRPNTLVIGSAVWNILADHPDFIDRVKYSERAIIGPELLAAVLELDRVIIASGVENTAAEGQTATFAFLAGKAALLAYVAPNPGLRVPSAGYTFSWTGYAGASAMGTAVSRIDMPWIKSERFELEAAFDFKVIAADLAVFFATAVA